MLAAPDGYVLQDAADVVVAYVELHLLHSHMDRRRDHRRILVRIDAASLAVGADAVAGNPAQVAVRVLADIRRRRSRFHNRNRRPPIGHLVEEQRHRTPHIVAAGPVDAGAAADVVPVCVRYDRWIGSGHKDRTVAPSLAGQTCIDPVRLRRVPNLHPGVEIHEGLAMSLASVDFDCIHLLMSQRPNPLPPTGGLWSWFL